MKNNVIKPNDLSFMNQIDNTFSFFYFNEKQFILLPTFIKKFSDVHYDFYGQSTKISMIGKYDQKLCLDFKINHIVSDHSKSSFSIALNMDSSLIIFNEIDSFNEELKNQILQSIYSTHVCLVFNCKADLSFLSESQRHFYNLNNLTIENKFKNF